MLLKGGKAGDSCFKELASIPKRNAITPLKSEWEQRVRMRCGWHLRASTSLLTVPSLSLTNWTLTVLTVASARFYVFLPTVHTVLWSQFLEKCWFPIRGTFFYSAWNEYLSPGCSNHLITLRRAPHIRPGRWKESDDDTLRSWDQLWTQQPLDLF